MSRIGRALVSLAVALPLLLSAATAALWARSHFTSYYLFRSVTGGDAMLVHVNRGRISVGVSPDAPVDVPLQWHRRGNLWGRETVDLIELRGPGGSIWGHQELPEFPTPPLPVHGWASSIDAPLLPAVIVLAVPWGTRAGIRLVRRRRGVLRGREGRCPSCGYDVRATPDRCPECGVALSVEQPAA